MNLSIWIIIIITLFILWKYTPNRTGNNTNNNNYQNNYQNNNYNYQDVQELIVIQKTHKLALWHMISDISPSLPFWLYLIMNGIFVSPIKLTQIGYKPCYQVQKLKNKYKRPRPYLVNSQVKIRPTISGYGWSYPSCHSAQGRYLGLILAKKYPKLAKKLIEIGELVGMSRIWAGVHYPSDHQAGKQVAETYFIKKNESL